jgi:hypothetical protein
MLALHPEYLQVRLIGAADNGLELVRVDSQNGLTVRVEGNDLQEKGHFPMCSKPCWYRQGRFTSHPLPSIMNAPPTTPRGGRA